MLREGSRDYETWQKLKADGRDRSASVVRLAI